MCLCPRTVSDVMPRRFRLVTEKLCYVTHCNKRDVLKDNGTEVGHDFMRRREENRGFSLTQFLGGFLYKGSLLTRLLIIERRMR